MSLDNLFCRSASLFTASEELATTPYAPVPTVDLSLNRNLKLYAKHLLLVLNERALKTRELKDLMFFNLLLVVVLINLFVCECLLLASNFWN